MRAIQKAQATFHTPLSRIELIAVLAATLLAIVLRFGWVGVSNFAFDEALISLHALNMARGGQFAFTGTASSVGAFFLPANIWIFSLPYLLSADPLFATLFVSLLNVVAIIATWLLARLCWGRWAALATVLFYAAAPFGVLTSRSVWEPNLLAPLSVAWGWTAYWAMTARDGRRRRTAIGLHVFLAGFIWQVHFSGIALALGTAWLALRNRWWRTPIPAVVGGGVALLMTTPYIYYVTLIMPQLGQRLLNVLGKASATDPEGLSNAIRIALGLDWGFLSLGILDTFSAKLAPQSIVAAGLLLLGLFSIVAELRQNPSHISENPELSEVTVLWLVVSPLFFIRHGTPVLIHYQLVALPALALIAGASTRLFKHQYWAPAISVLVAAVAIVWSVQVGQSLSRAGKEWTRQGLGTPLSITRNVAHSLPAGTPAIFFGHSDDPYVEGESTIFTVLWWNRPENRIAAGTSTVILPARPTYLLVSRDDLAAWQELEASALVKNFQQFERRQNAPPFVATLYDGKQTPAGFTMIEPIPFADGTQLEGWKTRPFNDGFRVLTLWQVLETPPQSTIQQFHHLRSADALEPDNLTFIGSDVPLFANSWQAGDRIIVISEFLPEEPATFWVDVGHYTLPDVVRFARTDGTGDSVRLGPFEVEE